MIVVQIGIKLGPFMPEAQIPKTVETFKEECVAMMEPDEPADEDEDAEDLCNCKFTLAYGKIFYIMNMCSSAGARSARVSSYVPPSASCCWTTAMQRIREALLTEHLVAVFADGYHWRVCR